MSHPLKSIETTKNSDHISHSKPQMDSIFLHSDQPQILRGFGYRHLVSPTAMWPSGVDLKGASHVASPKEWRGTPELIIIWRPFGAQLADFASSYSVTNQHNLPRNVERWSVIVILPCAAIGGLIIPAWFWGYKYFKTQRCQPSRNNCIPGRPDAMSFSFGTSTFWIAMQGGAMEYTNGMSHLYPPWKQDIHLQCHCHIC